MVIIHYISNLLIPLIIALIVVVGLLKKVPIYDAFTEGAKDGVITVWKVFPALLGLMVAVGALRASGTLTLLSNFVSPLADAVGYPAEAVPLTFMRLVSSAASRGLLLDLFAEYGPDSYIGRLVSVMMSSTETIFYTMSIYFMAVGIQKTRHTLLGALIANLSGVVASVWIVNRLWG